MGLLPPKQHREREKLLCYSGPKSVRECAEISIGCDVITKGGAWGGFDETCGALVNIYWACKFEKALVIIDRCGLAGLGAWRACERKHVMY
jgi:hypothetical protein